MLEYDLIASSFPLELRSHKRNILREYLQYKALEIIFRSKYGNKFVFIGGTCLHIVYGNNRFSEDLDFDICKPFDSDKLSKDVQPFLYKSDDSLRVKYFPDYIKQRIKLHT